MIGLDAERLGAAGEFRRVDGGVIPAEPHLDRHGHAGGRDARLDQPAGVVEIAHQRRARIAADDPLGRATHVDVDDPRPRGLGDAHALGHGAGIAAGELHHMRVDARALGPKLGFLVAFHQFVGYHHLGYDEARAQALRRPTERDVGHSRQGSEDGRHWNLGHRRLKADGTPNF